MKQIIMLGMALVMMLVSLGGCFIGYENHDRDENRSRNERHERGEGHEGGDGHEERD